MSNTATRLSLRTRVRSLADQTRSTYISDAEINGWLDLGLSQLHDIMIVHFEDYFENTVTFNTVPAQSDYALPSDFYKLLALDMLAGGIRYTVTRYMNRERNRLQNTPVNLGYGAAYRLVGNVLRLIPTPSSLATLTLAYAPQYIELADDATLVNQVIPQGWEEFAVLEASIRCMLKEEDDPSGLMAKKREFQQGIERLTDDRDANEPAHVTDVTRCHIGRFIDNCGDGSEWF